MNTLLADIKAADRRSLIEYQLSRVQTWQRTPSTRYNAVGYARRKPSAFMALLRALRGVFNANR